MDMSNYCMARLSRNDCNIKSVKKESNLILFLGNHANETVETQKHSRYYIVFVYSF